MEKIIFWDWNGTLLNDIDLCIESRNKVFVKYNAPAIDVHTYRQYFTFPVKKYYFDTGISEEVFDKAACEWFDYYNEHFRKAELNIGVEDILKYTMSKGYSNVILSASQKNLLLDQISYYNLNNYFEDILALENIYAESKLSIALNYLKNKEANVYLIGDTMHDYDVAQTINASCFIYENGHQYIKQNNVNNAIIIDLLLKLKGYLR